MTKTGLRACPTCGRLPWSEVIRKAAVMVRDVQCPKWLDKGVRIVLYSILWAGIVLAAFLIKLP